MEQSTRSGMMDRKTIEEWLRNYVAQCLEQPSADIDVDATFVDLGLSSRDAVTMTAELEAMTGNLIDPAVVFDFPTIQSLAGYLESAHADSR